MDVQPADVKETPQSHPGPQEVPTCRICRCEAAPDLPLFHPCKCRGSIKYIHQDCLQDWLAHSQKSKCDICHEEYHFQDLYNEDAPKVPPVSLIVRQAFNKFLEFQYFIVKHLLMLICGFEAFIFVNAVDVITDWQLGIPLPLPNDGFITNILFDPSAKFKGTDLYPMEFSFSLTKGVKLSLVYVIIIGAMVLIQSSIVSDEGFKKIIRKKIGPELSPLQERQHHQQAGIRFEAGPLHGQARPAFAELAGAAPDAQRNELLQMLARENQLAEEDRELELDFQRRRDELSSRLSMRALDRVMNEIPEEQVEDIDNELNESALALQEEERRVEIQRRQRHAAMIDRLNRIREANDERIQRRRAQERGDAALAAALANQANVGGGDDDEDANIPNFWGGPKNISFILQVTVLVNLVACAVIVSFKLIPCFIGLSCMILFGHLVSFLTARLSQTSLFSLAYLQIVNSNIVASFEHLKQSSKLVNLVSAYLSNEVLIPLYHSYLSIVKNQPQNTFYCKLMLFFAGYSFLAAGIAIIKKHYENSCSQQNPLTSNHRQFYIFLLQIVCMVKVFVLMAIEWLVFPFYAGFMMQLAMVAFSNDNLYSTGLPDHLILSDIFGSLPIWFMGTFFMYFFASFVGLIRKKILREGVLFFIRPSDDPNIRLIHDALMRPFGLKISRILLSAGVYTFYIIIEIISPIWLIRLSGLNILPVHHKYWFETGIYLSLFIIGKESSPLFLKYWEKSFDIASSYSRLSSFLLKKEVVKERGRLHYRNFYQRIVHNEEPDYENPIEEDQIEDHFNQNPNVNCVFVPDGNFVRAPDSDYVSRKFVKTLFYPVSRNDQLLVPMPEIPNDDHIFNPYDDEEPMEATTYTLVYMPPKFRVQLGIFFSILWLSSIILTFGIYSFNSAFKLLVSLVLGGSNPFPNLWYQIDPYSMIITVTCISYSKYLSPLITSNDENDRNVESIWNTIKSMAITVIRNERLQYYFNKVKVTITLSTLLLFGNQKLLSSNSYSSIFVVHLMILPLGYAVKHAQSKPKYMKIYYYTAALMIGLRIFTLMVGIASAIEPLKNLEPSQLANTTALILNGSDLVEKFPLTYYLIKFLAFKDPQTEGEIFQVIWCVVGADQLFVMGYELCGNFIEEVRKVYYSSGKLLSNVEVEEEEFQREGQDQHHENEN